jgi:hypothetical protein
MPTAPPDARLLELWIVSSDAREDPEAAFRELRDDPVLTGGTPVADTSRCDQTLALAGAAAGAG